MNANRLRPSLALDVTLCTSHAFCSCPAFYYASYFTCFDLLRYQGFNYCREILASKIEDFKAISTSEHVRKMLSLALRKLDKMKMFLSDFLQQQFCLRGEVSDADNTSDTNLPNASSCITISFRSSPLHNTTTCYGGSLALQVSRVG